MMGWTPPTGGLAKVLADMGEDVRLRLAQTCDLGKPATKGIPLLPATSALSPNPIQYYSQPGVPIGRIGTLCLERTAGLDHIGS